MGKNRRPSRYGKTNIIGKKSPSNLGISSSPINMRKASNESNKQMGLFAVISNEIEQVSKVRSPQPSKYLIIPKKIVNTAEYKPRYNAEQLFSLNAFDSHNKFKNLGRKLKKLITKWFKRYKIFQQEQYSKQKCQQKNKKSSQILNSSYSKNDKNNQIQSPTINVNNQEKLKQKKYSSSMDKINPVSSLLTMFAILDNKIKFLHRKSLPFNLSQQPLNAILDQLKRSPNGQFFELKRELTLYGNLQYYIPIDNPEQNLIKQSQLLQQSESETSFIDSQSSEYQQMMLEIERKRMEQNEKKIHLNLIKQIAHPYKCQNKTLNNYMNKRQFAQSKINSLSPCNSQNYHNLSLQSQKKSKTIEITKSRKYGNKNYSQIALPNIKQIKSINKRSINHIQKCNSQNAKIHVAYLPYLSSNSKL